jgi:hypothetical protein
MGWYKIDPHTGKPLQDSPSKMSTPDTVLLNAVPGVDAAVGDCYLGDGPWDMSSTMPTEIADVVGDEVTLSDDELRALLLCREVPASVGGARSEVGDELLQVVAEFWEDIDSCYEDDWERPAQEAEKRWISEFVIERQKRLNES